MKTRGLRGVVASLALLGATAHADDVDTYLPQYQADGGGGQPQVMIVFDTSVSMSESAGSRSRLAVARETVSDLVRRYPGINFSLTAFNSNELNCGFFCFNAREINNGGRVVLGFPDAYRQSVEARETLLDTLSDLQANTSTPLCETMHEVYRYFSGDRVVYGAQRGRAQPPRDRSVEQSGAYRSPLRACESVYVVYMTDGLPQWDTSSNDDIKQRVGLDWWQSCNRYPAAGSGSRIENCLPELTAHMATQDIAPDLVGDQRAYTFTIGFNTSQRLLEDAAQPPEGIEQGYFEATDDVGLDRAFAAILGSIQNDVVNARRYATATNLAGTENRNAVYSPYLEPKGYRPWDGNLKKFVFDEERSALSSERDLWSVNEAERQAPNVVTQGGAGARLRAQVSVNEGRVTGRRLYTDMGMAAGLEPIERLDEEALRTGMEAANREAANLLGQSAYTFTQLAQWLKGRDVTEESETEVRPWLMGDIIHSTPLAINYGCPGSAATCTEDEARLRVFVGTNEGVLHAIDDDDGREAWAFWPQESAGMAAFRMLNASPAYPWAGGYIEQSTHYGVDGRPAVWLDYGERRIEGTLRRTLDEAILAFGFRRGGRGYYALDVSDYDRAPDLAWRAQGNTDNRWGQSWSTPVAAALSGREAPVFMFGGGYDVAYDAGLPDAAALGASFNVLDVRNGATVARLSHQDLVDSVAADVTPVDRDFDGVTDGAFFGDLGGNLWFADLAGPADGWALQQVAALGRHQPAGEDRRFFNRANLVRTFIDRQPVDLLMIGSGDRTAPTDESARNAFYVIEVSDWLNEGTRVPEALDEGDLITVDAAAETTLGVPVDEDTQRFDKAAFDGWRLSLAPGEKVLSDAATIGGRTLFTSFKAAPVSDMCMASRGESTLYGFGLPQWRMVDNVRIQVEGSVESASLGAYIQDTPALLVRGQGASVLGEEAGEAVGEVLGDDSADGDDGTGESRCGEYITEENRFGSCLISTPVWWYQQ